MIIKNNILIKDYKSFFKYKKKYSLKDFIDYEKQEGIFQINSMYRAINPENLHANIEGLSIPSFYKQTGIFTKNRDYCVEFLNLPLLIIIQKYNLKKISFDSFKEELYAYFNISKKENFSKSKNNTFLMSNKNSIELPRDKELYPSLEKYRQDLGFLLLEVNSNFKYMETFEFFKELREFLNKIEIKKIKTNFRIRKILKLKKNGMFIVRANTLVIDPRIPEKVIHEIGHYIYENGIPFTLNGKRIYKSSFPYIVKKNKDILNGKINNIHKYEDYEIESEIFAYWFENLYS